MNGKILLIPAVFCASLFGVYQYYYTDTFYSINTNNWTQNGVLTAGSTGLTSSDYYGGSLISRVAVPDGSHDYEVSTVFSIAASGGVFVHYLRATQDAKGGMAAQGAFYSFEISPTLSEHGCSASVSLYKRDVSGAAWMLAFTYVPCRNGAVMRSVRMGDRMHFYVDGVLYIAHTESGFATGQPGVGVFNAPAGNTIAKAQLGALDRTAPNPVNPQAVGVSARANSVDLQWDSVSDDANGIGVWLYRIWRDGSWWMDERQSPRLTDDTVAPATTYSYQIQPCDYHMNCGVAASVTVTTPPAGSIDPRRTGVRPTGSYWGGGGEQIDVRSGNLHFALPLLKAMARNNWSVSLGLSYNSQVWRQDGGGVWNLGADVGYGFGWRLMAGSLAGVWSDTWTLHHYVFTDSTGAEYRLDVNTNGVWTSREGVYVSYDAATGRLYFPDGSFWVMGSQSAGTEQDAGTRYPTLMQDSNGNQILLRYQAGLGMPWSDSSARLSQIQDFRANRGYVPPRTFVFNYNTDPIPHLISLENWIGTSEKYTFGYQGQALWSPFPPQQAFGSTTVLTSVTTTGLNLAHQFQYDASGTGELTQVTLPFGARLRWTYANAPYSGSRLLRRVAGRYFASAAGAAETGHSLESSLTGAETVPLWGCVTSGDGVGQQCWFFHTDTSSPYVGLVAWHEERPGPAVTPKRASEYGWTQDGGGTPYIGSVLTTLDPGTADAVQSKTEQTLDTHGNVVQSKLYDYGNLSTPARTYDHVYLTGTQYSSRYIFNRLLQSRVTAGGTTTLLVSNTYDTGTCTPGLPGTYPTTLSEHDSAAYGPNFFYRGNLSARSGVAQPYTAYRRDITGAVRGQCDALGRSVSVDTSTANYAAPGVITPGAQSNLATRLSYTSFMGVASATGPNNSTATTVYDGYARPYRTDSPHGAITTYTYTNSPPTRTATTNGRWEKTTYDGLGRVVKVERGDGAPSNPVTRTVVDTEYGPCACSPLGKVKRVSQPYAPGGAVRWTTYNYDGLGRTVSVVAADGASTTTYTYAGNRVTVTDPAGKTKTFTTDAFGNLVKVTEPNPGGGTVETLYTYDALNNLTQVSMPRGGYTQTRTFVYEGRLLRSATNPETGTVTYTYNSDWTVASRTDAKGQKLTYEYDEYKRLTRIRTWRPGGQEDLDQTVEFYYDWNPFDATVSENGWGRLTATVARVPPDALPPYYPPTLIQMYGYTRGGLVKTKRLRVNQESVNNIDLDVGYTYDDEGRQTSVTYPLYHYNASQAYRTYTYGFDTMGRPNKLTESTTAPGVPPVDLVTAVEYGAADEMLQMQYNPSYGTYTETRQYNELLQLTRLTGSGAVLPAVDVEYRYAAGQNNGRITQQKDRVTGEEVTYTYDSLQRLVAAVTTGPEWGTQYVYDGWGNLTQKVVTKGSAPAFSAAVDAATNRLVGYSYDANGNLLANGAQYDVQNRLMQHLGVGGYEYYGYGADNKRIWRHLPNGTQELYVYGADGQRLATYDVGRDSETQTIAAWQAHTNIYFGGKLIKAQGHWVVTDRLGSVRVSSAGERLNYYPYGEERGTTANNREKFGTYFRDNAGLDYADQRYYNSSIGRFLTADPYAPGTRGETPQSLNLYAYVEGDPANSTDPTGENFAWRSRPDEMGGSPTFGKCRVLGFLPAPKPFCYFLPGVLVGAAPVSTARKPRYYFLVVTSDCYRVPKEGAVTREITYELRYLEEGMPVPMFTNQGVIWEHLSAGLGSLDRPDSPSSGPPGTFPDQQSIAGIGTRDQSGTQRFTAVLSSGISVQLGVAAFGGTISNPVRELSIDKHAGYVSINGYIGGSVDPSGNLIPGTYRPCP